MLEEEHFPFLVCREDLGLQAVEQEQTLPYNISRAEPGDGLSSQRILLGMSETATRVRVPLKELSCCGLSITKGVQLTCATLMPYTAALDFVSSEKGSRSNGEKTRVLVE